MSRKPYEVQKSNYDATRPYAVVATFRRFNKVIDRYEDEDAAKRRTRSLNVRSQVKEVNEDDRYVLREI